MKLSDPKGPLQLESKNWTPVCRNSIRLPVPDPPPYPVIWDNRGPAPPEHGKPTEIAQQSLRVECPCNRNTIIRTTCTGDGAIFETSKRTMCVLFRLPGDHCHR